jgi:hypothetical protein
MPKRMNNISPLIDNFFSQRLGQSKRVKRKKQDEDGRGGTKGDYDRVTISHLGKLLNAIKQELKDSGNKQALSGFKKIMNLIGHPPSNLVTVNFADIAAVLSERGSPDFIRLFTTADLLESEDFALNKWINCLVNLNPEQLSYHLDLTGLFIKNKDRTGLDYYLDSINRLVHDQKLDRELKIEKLDGLINGLKKFDRYQQMKKYLQSHLQP